MKIFQTIKQLVIMVMLLSFATTTHAQLGSKEEPQALVAYSFQAYFQEAYRQYPAIPKGVLEAVSYTNTRLRHVGVSDVESCVGVPKTYGVMGLTLDGKGYFNNNLQLISELSGYNVSDIINSPEKNILGFAQAFATLYSDRKGENIEADKRFLFDVLAQLSELPDNGGSSNYALNTYLYSVYSFLENSEMQRSFGFPDHSIDAIKVFGAKNLKVLSSGTVILEGDHIKGQDGTEYINNSFSGGCLDYSPAIWVAAPSCNYSSRNGTAIDAVTIHTIQGSYAGAISWFQNCNANVTAHYVVRSSDGQVTQMVCESDKAWHVGSENPYTIGIEHDGYVEDPQTWYTEALYEGSAAIVRDITQSGYSIDPIRTFYNPPGIDWNEVMGGCTKVKGHINFPNQSHTDPGVGWDWEHYYQLINNNPNVISYVNGSGNFYDSGGEINNYSDDERDLYLIEPTNATSITLSFSQFDMEADWDYMYIYDGNSLSSSVIGIYTGSNSPGSITSSGGALLVEFRSDCSLNNAGWAASWTSEQNNGQNPDLQIIAAIAQPDTVYPGENTELTYTIENIGSESVATTSMTGYYLIPLADGCPTATPPGTPFFQGLLDVSEMVDNTETEVHVASIPVGTSPGPYYLVIVTDWENDVVEENEGNNVFCIPFEISDPNAPLNNYCEDAIVLTPQLTCINTLASLESATASGIAQASCDAYASPALFDVWFEFVATSPENQIMLTSNASFDGVMAVYDACSGTEIFCSDVNGTGENETIFASSLTFGNTYYIRVYDYGVFPPTDPTFEICVLGELITSESVVRKNEFKIFPNPALGVFKLIIPKSEQEVSVEVYSSDDRLVYHRKVKSSNNPEFTIDLTGQAEGIYLVRVITGAEVLMGKLNLLTP